MRTPIADNASSDCEVIALDIVRAKKIAAQEATHRVAGVLDVANDIEVKPVELRRFSQGPSQLFISSIETSEFRGHGFCRPIQLQDYKKVKVPYGADFETGRPMKASPLTAN